MTKKACFYVLMPMLIAWTGSIHSEQATATTVTIVETAAAPAQGHATTTIAITKPAAQTQATTNILIHQTNEFLSHQQLRRWCNEVFKQMAGSEYYNKISGFPNDNQTVTRKDLRKWWNQA